MQEYPSLQHQTGHMASFETTQDYGRSNRPLALVEPNPKGKLGQSKLRKFLRAQDILESLGWLSILFVIFTFLIDGGVQEVKDFPSALGAIDRISALVATDLLLIQTLLISRVPWLEKIYGHDRATLTHKRLGKPILYLVIVHFEAVVW